MAKVVKVTKIGKQSVVGPRQTVDDSFGDRAAAPGPAPAVKKKTAAKK